MTSLKRWEGLEDIPTIAETVAGYEADVWYGIVAPRGTPPEIASVLSKAVNSALADPQLRSFCQRRWVPMPMSSAEFDNGWPTNTRNGAKSWNSQEYRSIRSSQIEVTTRHCSVRSDTTIGTCGPVCRTESYG